MDRRGIVLLCALTSCSAPAPRAEVEPAPIAEGGESVTPDEAPAPTPVEAVATAPRFEVPPPADLAAAIAARRPLIEIVPQACAESPGPVGASADVICLRDPRSGLVRATRRVNLSGSGVVAAARHGDDVVFTALDPAYAHTRYAGHLWRWTLADDRYAGLAEIPSHDDDGIDYGVATDFGIVVRSWPGDDGEVDWLFAGGSLRRLRSVEGLNEIAPAERRRRLLRGPAAARGRHDASAVMPGALATRPGRLGYRRAEP